MRYLRKNLQVTVVADTPEDYDNKMNEIFAKATTVKSITDKDFLDKFCSIVRFEYKEDIPENARERYEIKNECHYCGECREWVKPDKGNVKYTPCPHQDFKCGFNTQACDFFYEMLEAGEDMWRHEDV